VPGVWLDLGPIWAASLAEHKNTHRGYSCDRAFPPPEHLGRGDGETAAEWETRLGEAGLAELNAWRKAHRWHPHQLRHLAATRLRAEFGIESARTMLGHSSASVTEIYAQDDMKAAAEAMQRVG
jgi:integrase